MTASLWSPGPEDDPLDRFQTNDAPFDDKLDASRQDAMQSHPWPFSGAGVRSLPAEASASALLYNYTVVCTWSEQRQPSTLNCLWGVPEPPQELGKVGNIISPVPSS